jgi:hypothetical protein
MPTNIDREGNYPLPEDIGYKVHYESFNFLWRENFYLSDEVVNNPKLEEQFKSLAKKVYTEMIKQSVTSLVESSNIQDTVNMAYEDGYEDGRRKGIDECIGELESL